MATMKTKLSNAIVEKDVENIYREALMTYLKDAEITSPFSCDGLLKADNIRTILEFKFEDALKNKLSQSNILIQVIYYLKKFETAGEKLPTTIFVADKNECFALDTKAVVKYLDHKINWTLAPSVAHKLNGSLVKAMVDDIDILPFVFDVDDNFTIDLIVDKIRELGNDGVRKVKVTSKNIASIFEYFDKNVIPNTKLATNEKANLFVQILVNPNSNYMHPKKQNTLCTEAFGDIQVNGKSFQSFFAHFEDRVYSPKEKEAMTGLIDRLVEDTTRRSKGEFYTPTVWVSESHSMISESLGENWKEEYIVWDCCAGTFNLTRDYRFGNLYCSTLEQCDIDTANQMGYNREAVKFQFDFLNDPIFDNELMNEKSKVPAELQQALKDGKKVLFLINPPYARSGNMDKESEFRNTGLSETVTGIEMKDNGWGKSAQQLYTQFLYRIAELNTVGNIDIAIFAKSLYKTGSSFKTFRKNFYTKFNYCDGMLFNASHFSDTANTWAIDFSIWKSGVETRDNLMATIKDISPLEGIVSMGDKDIYNLDKHENASDWVGNDKGKKKLDTPKLSSFITVKDKGHDLVENSLGFFMNMSNNVYYNGTNVGMFSTGFSHKGTAGLSVLPENFEKVCSLFTARKAIAQDWMNDKDEYFAPNEQHPEWEQYCRDSIVYALFNNSSQQSSLRDIDYKEKKWDIKNEWFWMYRYDMMELANDNGYDAMYNDARTSQDRFVAEKLAEVYNDLSDEAKAVLDMAKDLTVKSIEMRQLMAEQDSSLHLDSWDAGYAQLKLVWKQYFPEEFKAFREAYKTLEQKMIPMVYELGFLKH